ncbi:hypothetical protein PanWU01x14_019880 [Parasponia andersonii]|uniref:Disease resistance N-terminal domain-containing protein n=1 Tax=Parasponia andersonii TaxID=3476 RepID=A0A2P5DYL0_PARAD|nr:hypothetical protein PanWU01x14_019880 [Parasponia andersonii]
MAAETFLSPVIQKLVELLAEEVSLFKGIHRKLKSLKDEPEIIQPFLKDAEAKSQKGEVCDATKLWLGQIREEAERIEVVIDEYIYRVEQQHHHQRACIGSLRIAGHFIKDANNLFVN